MQTDMSAIFIKKTEKRQISPPATATRWEVLFMSDEVKTEKEQQECKIRCAQFLLDMIEKYGAEVKAETEERTSEKS